MKSKTIKLTTTIGVLMLLFLFVGQKQYDKAGSFMRSMKELYRLQLSTISKGKAKTYISTLSFMDVKTQSIIASSIYAELINKAFTEIFRLATYSIPYLAINEPGHRVKNTDANANKLMNITFDPNMSKKEKIDKIIDEFMTPNHVDILFTGQYIDDANNPVITIRPIIIVKADKKIATKNLQFTLAELFCKDPQNGELSLCGSAYDQIAQGLIELFSQL